VLPDADRAARPPSDLDVVAGEDSRQSARGEGALGRFAVPAAVLTVLVGVVLRFIAPSALWLDEAQSVAIAHSDLTGLFAALRQDGAPPFYYLLLHAWMSVFGTGAFAVRALSGLFSVLSLPLAWWLGRRLGGPRVAGVLVLILASSPFAVRYATETRMYSLLVLLALLVATAVDWAVRRPGPGPVLAVAASGGALLLTHYWGAYLLVVVGLIALARLRRHRAAAVRVLTGLLLAGVVFLPWLPTVRWQSAHTGTPWAGVGGLTSITVALGGWQGGGSALALLLGDVFVVLAVLALFTVPAGTVVRLGVSRSPLRWLLLAIWLGTLVVAGVASLLTSSGVVARYSSVAFPAFLALVAIGIVGLPGRRVKAAVLAACVLGGLVVSVMQAGKPRTQAAEVATALGSASPGDTVVFCPDQLGPAVSRLAPAGLHLLSYPNLTPADRVDWTDYAERNREVEPAVVAARVSAQAGNHAVYVVTGRGYRVPSDTRCSRLRDALTQLRGAPEQVVQRSSKAGEAMRMHRFPPLGPPTGS
jgi:mannosyltransferase